MIIVESILGNESDPAWEEKLLGATIDELPLDQWEAQKNRIRKTTTGGAEVALSLDRSSHLHNGDILVWDEGARRAVVARIELSDVLVIELADILADSPETLSQTCFELGHALGNQHWPAVVNGSKVYVPLTVDRNVMASVMKTHAFSGITYEFIAGLEVIPYLAPHETRRLFGGADATPHSHLHAAGHGHAHHHDHSH